MKKIILLVTTIVVVTLVIILPVLIIKAKIECKSQYGDCPSSLVSELNSLNGKKIYIAKREAKKILKKSFIVTNYIIQLKLPDTLRIDLIIKKPFFALRNIGSGTSVLVDKEGNVLAESETTALPTVNTVEVLPKIGEKVSAKDLTALELIDGVYKMYQTGTGNIEGDTLLIDLPGQVRVIFPLVDADRDLLLGSLRLIYSNIQGSTGNTYTQIDLRYKNPVLR